MSTGRNAKKIKITVDTNILISVFVFPGAVVVNILDAVIDGRLKLGLSDEILREFTGVCVRKFDYDPEDAVRLSDIIRRYCDIVYPEKRLKVIKDDPDNRILECAIEYKADYIISGDKHLLDLKKHKGIKIIPPAEFIKIKVF